MDILQKVNGWVWGAPALILILGVGVYLSVGTGFAQIRLFPRAMLDFINRFSERNQSEGNTPYRALCTALAATVGTGNLVGVAGAIAIGGPGAVFWMWVCAFLGMVTKFAEATLAVFYREKQHTGEYFGGPMYMIEKGLGKKWKPMAVLYAFFGVIASLGVGNATQINAVMGGIENLATVVGIHFGQKGKVGVAFVLAVCIISVLRGGTKRIGSMAEKLVPFCALAYLVMGFLVLAVRYDAIPTAFRNIVSGAFSPGAVTGGMVGSAFSVLRIGASRGVFSNEAGMGTASIAHGGAVVSDPVEQGLMGIIEVFIDTILICTITALVILVGGVPIPYGTEAGTALATNAFSATLGAWATIPISLSLCVFGIATVLGWSLYGMRCCQYLFGEGVWRRFAFFQGALVILGAVMGTGTVWILSEIVNGLMAIPNLIALAILSPKLFEILRQMRLSKAVRRR